MLLSKLYLGRTIAEGAAPILAHNAPGETTRTVSDSALAYFLENTVTPYFQGFTVVHAEGFWQGKPEKTAILEIIHEERESFKVANIAEEYRAFFCQDSVLVLTVSETGVSAQF